MEQQSEIIFWFDSPPKVGKGAFNYVANHWTGPVYYVFNNDFRAERKAVNWDDGDFGRAHTVALYEHADEPAFLDAFFAAHAEAVHVVCGFTTRIMRKLRSHLCRRGVRLLVFSERPVTMGGRAERLLREAWFRLKYTHLRHVFEPYTSAFLPLGMLGVRTFRRYGWPQAKLWPFMYNPQIAPVEGGGRKTAGAPLQFLYVGRFYHKTKGTDVLMKSASGLVGNWHLDLVGGYGPDAAEVEAWAERQPHVSYVGRWSAGDVLRRMAAYDVVVVPSRYDGWNLLVNEAFHAGVGVIATDGAVSDELVSASGAGLVVPAGRPDRLRAAMQHAVNHPDEVAAWKERAAAFCPRISVDAVGRYLQNIISHVFFGAGERPQCPWL